MLEKIRKALDEKASSEKAEVLQRFFKTGAGEYGEGDIFIGVTVPNIRAVAKQFKDAEFEIIEELVNSEIHEERMLGLIILTYQFPLNEKEIFDFYIKNLEKINNWDLVDVTCPRIVGVYLSDKPRNLLYDLARSDNLWKRRVGIVSTYSFIRNGELEDTLKISEMLLNDSHDLMHKAVGWMLREVGKKDVAVLENFLKKHYKKMPRTMLRYSIEKFDEDKRKRYLREEV